MYHAVLLVLFITHSWRHLTCIRYAFDIYRFTGHAKIPYFAALTGRAIFNFFLRFCLYSSFIIIVVRVNVRVCDCVCVFELTF